MTTFYVAKVGDIPEGTGKAFEINGLEIAVFNVGGEFKATDDFCRHKGGSLGEGSIDGNIVICPLHNWKYDVNTGECLTDSSVKPLTIYPTKITGDRIGVELK